MLDHQAVGSLPFSADGEGEADGEEMSEPSSLFAYFLGANWQTLPSSCVSALALAVLPMDASVFLLITGGAEASEKAPRGAEEAGFSTEALPIR